MRMNPAALWRFVLFPFLSRFLNPGFAWAPVIASVAGSVVGGLLSKSGADKASAAMDRQAAIAEGQLQLAREQWGRFKELYGPLEESIVEEAGRPADVEGARGRASNDVVQAFTKARGITKRNMARMGVNPNSGAYGAAMGRQDIEMAKADAAARYAAGEGEKDRALARKMSAVQLGRGLPAAAMNGMSAAGRVFGNMANAYGAAAGNMARFGYNMGSNIARGIMAGYGGGSGGSYTPFSGSWDQASSNFDSANFDDISAFSNNFADGGEVVGPGTETSDSVPINASNGEFVIPADVVRKKGTEFFEKLIDKYHVPARGLPAAVQGIPAPAAAGLPA